MGRINFISFALTIFFVGYSPPSPTVVSEQIAFNEIVASNNGGLTDEDGDSSDWIELYNLTEHPVSLDRWSLTDESEEPGKWTFPAVTIDAGGYLVVFASKKDRAPIDGGWLHTNFKLDSDGEYLALHDDRGVIQSMGFFYPRYPEQLTDVSYGFYHSFSTYRYLYPPTPGASNDTSAAYEGIVPDTKFSVNRGFYDTSFELAITCDANDAQIRYTLDGSEPTADTGNVYTVPVNIEGTSTVRASAYKAGWIPTNVDTHTYIFVADIAVQSPHHKPPGPGWPSGSVNGQVLNYNMDPDVVNDRRYKDLIDDALLSIPSISLVTDLDNLFDPDTGIYVNAEESGRDWERPTSVELINPDGTEGFQIDAGFRIRGGTSRQDFYPKHAFRLYFRGEYGAAKLNFPLFDDEGPNEFDKLGLRCSKNFSWSENGDVRATFNRDVFGRDTQRDMGQIYTRSRYYHLYLNGAYWGLYQSQERSDAEYAQTYLGGSSDDYDIIKVEDYGDGTPCKGKEIAALDGNTDAYYRLWQAATAGFHTDEAYYRVQGKNSDGTPNPDYEVLVDIDNLIDYLLSVYYTGNFDGPIFGPSSWCVGRDSMVHNFYCIYNRNGGDGFKFLAHDCEFVLHLNDLYINRTGPFDIGAQFVEFNPQWLFQRLERHPGFRERIRERIELHFTHGGALTPEKAEQRFLRRANEIDLAVIAESARWGDSRGGGRESNSPRTRDDHWLPAINGIVENYIPYRSKIVLDQLKAKGWYP